MKKLLLIPVILLATLAVNSCKDSFRQVVNPNTLNIPQAKVVLVSYLSLDADTTFFTLGQTIPLNQTVVYEPNRNKLKKLWPWDWGPNVLPLIDAKLEVVDESAKPELTRVPMPNPDTAYSRAILRLPEIDMPMRIGHTYVARVKGTALGEVEARCTLHPMPKINHSFTLVQNTSSNAEDYWEFKIDRLTTNYPRYFICQLVVKPKKAGSVLNSLNKNYFFLSTEDDSDNSGELRIKQERKPGVVTSGDGYIFANDDISVGMYVMEVDANVYKFWKRVSAQQSAERDPFAAPVALFSNIEGGIGIFGQVQNQGVSFSK